MGPIPNLPPHGSSMHDLPLPFVMPFNWVKCLLKTAQRWASMWWGGVMSVSDWDDAHFPIQDGFLSRIFSQWHSPELCWGETKPFYDSTPQRWGELHFGGATAAGYWSWFHLWTCAKMRTPTKQEWSGWKRWKELFGSRVGNIINVFGHIWYELGWK